MSSTEPPFPYHPIWKRVTASCCSTGVWALFEWLVKTGCSSIKVRMVWKMRGETQNILIKWWWFAGFSAKSQTSWIFPSWGTIVCPLGYHVRRMERRVLMSRSFSLCLCSSVCWSIGVKIWCISIDKMYWFSRSLYMYWEWWHFFK